MNEWDRECVGCGRPFPAARIVDECGPCRTRRLKPLIDMLAGFTPGEREAYVRGILSDRYKAHDVNAIRELGAILDRLRSERPYGRRQAS